ncbi:MAG: fibronectin type III domain-containing protein [bacterium]
MKNILFLLYSALFSSGLILFNGCDKKPTAPEPTSNAAPQTSLKSGSNDEHSGAQIPFAFVRMFIEANSTDQDAGIQVHFDGEAWKNVRILGTDGENILEIEAESGLKELGLTELRFESAEPSPAEVLALFPAGNYKFKGRTVEGDQLVGMGTLSHDLPAAPIFSPSNGESVNRNNTVIKWNPIPGVSGYEVIVTNSDIGVSMELNVVASVTSLHVPPTFLQPNTKYVVEVLSIAPNGNKNITQGSFSTLP